MQVTFFGVELHHYQHLVPLGHESIAQLASNYIAEANFALAKSRQECDVGSYYT
jgi:hypothetical protein